MATMENKPIVRNLLSEFEAAANEENPPVILKSSYISPKYVYRSNDQPDVPKKIRKLKHCRDKSVDFNVSIVVINTIDNKNFKCTTFDISYDIGLCNFKSYLKLCTVGNFKNTTSFDKFKEFVTSFKQDENCSIKVNQFQYMVYSNQTKKLIYLTSQVHEDWEDSQFGIEIDDDDDDARTTLTNAFQTSIIDFLTDSPMT